MKALRANGIPWGTKLTILGGLRKERRPRKKKIEVKPRSNIFTSKELRGLPAVHNEGVDQNQVVADLEVKNSVSKRVKSTRKRSGKRK